MRNEEFEKLDAVWNEEFVYVVPVGKFCRNEECGHYRHKKKDLTLKFMKDGKISVQWVQRSSGECSYWDYDEMTDDRLNHLIELSADRRDEKQEEIDFLRRYSESLKEALYRKVNE